MAGLTLSSRDVSGMRTVIDACRQIAPSPGLSTDGMAALKDLIGCDELDVSGQDWRVLGHYFEQILFEDLEEYRPQQPVWYDGVGEQHVFWGNFWEMPCSLAERTGDYSSVMAISDFVSLPQMRADYRYRDNMIARGFRHEMMAVWPDGPGRSVHLLCWRSPGPDFSERERFMLTLLRPHLAAAHWRGSSSHSSPEGFSPLTKRQAAVLRLVGHGYTNRQVARRMEMSEATVRTHLNAIYRRLEVSSRTAAVARVQGSSDPGARGAARAHAGVHL